jgi:hypothetical protein
MTKQKANRFATSMSAHTASQNKALRLFARMAFVDNTQSEASETIEGSAGRV